jgi:hypothetical protein
MCPAEATLLVLLAAPCAAESFDEITRSVGESTRTESCARMEAWIREHPSDPNAGRGLVWMAQLDLGEHAFDDARRHLERAVTEYPDSEWALHGTRGLAALDLEGWRFGSAIARYQTLAARPEPFWNYLGRMGTQDAQGARTRFLAFIAAALGLFGLATARCVLARRRRAGLLRPLPEELTFTLPVFVLMLLAALHQEGAERRGVVTLALGAMALLWANGAYLRASPPRGWAVLREAGLGLLQAGALLYCAIVVNGLWEKFHDTLLMGAE